MRPSLRRHLGHLLRRLAERVDPPPPPPTPPPAPAAERELPLPLRMVLRMPELLPVVARHALAQGPGVLLLDGPGDPSPAYVPLRAIRDGDAAVPGLAILRQACEEARGRGADLARDSVIAVSHPGGLAVYVLASGRPAPEARRVEAA